MITKPGDLTGKVNDAFAQRKFTFLSGEIWETLHSVAALRKRPEGTVGTTPGAPEHYRPETSE